MTQLARHSCRAQAFVIGIHALHITFFGTCQCKCLQGNYRVGASQHQVAMLHTKAYQVPGQAAQEASYTLLSWRLRCLHMTTALVMLSEDLANMNESFWQSRPQPLSISLVAMLVPCLLSMQAQLVPGDMLKPLLPQAT
jgi:hypothetical protein